MPNPGPSVRAAPYWLSFVGTVVVQDAAAGLAEQFPDHAVHQLLLADVRFRCVSRLC